MKGCTVAAGCFANTDQIQTRTIFCIHSKIFSRLSRASLAPRFCLPGLYHKKYNILETQFITNIRSIIHLVTSMRSVLSFLIFCKFVFFNTVGPLQFLKVSESVCQVFSGFYKPNSVDYRLPQAHYPVSTNPFLVSESLLQVSAGLCKPTPGVCCFCRLTQCLCWLLYALSRPLQPFPGVLQFCATGLCTLQAFSRRSLKVSSQALYFNIP